MDVVFDIDRTLADLTHRLHFIKQSPKDWDGFYGALHRDAVIEPVAAVLRALSNQGNAIIFCTGRSETTRPATKAWLSGEVFGPARNFPLYMRPDGDHRKDAVVKEMLLDRMFLDGLVPALVFEDRSSVVAMWRSRGIPCLQTTEGEF